MSGEAPRVLLAAAQGLAARALVRTGVLDELLAGGATVTVLAPRDAALAGELAERGVALEPLADVDAILARSTLRKLFVVLRFYTLGEGRNAGTLQVKMRTARAELAAERPWLARAVALAVRPLWRSRALRRALLAAELRLDRATPHAEVLDRVRPDLVVTAGPGYGYADALVLREAGRRGIRTCALTPGWDNPTAKGYRGADPDRVLVWSQKMAGEAERHQDVPRDRISVVGNPHFDRYARPGELLGREELCAALGLDPGRPVVAFATPSPDLWAMNGAVAETLAAAGEDGRLGARAQLVIRPHPNFSLPRSVESLDPLRAVAERHPDAHLMLPELRAGAMALDTTPGDVLRLASLLAHAAVVVTVFSTPTLEAFLLDTPVVALAEDLAGPQAGERRGGRRSWERFSHLQGVIAGGAAPVARSLDELVALVAAYLADPEKDRNRRRRAALEETGPADGRAGQRAGHELLRLASWRR